jgi:excisionase family DNA binding protein
MFVTDHVWLQSNVDEAFMSNYESLLSNYFTQAEAATELKVSPRTVDRWRRLGEGPPVTKVGRRVLYRREGLHAWLRAREHQTQDGAS